MRIKLDENLPVALGVALTRLGHDVDTVMAEGLTGSPDPEVWLAAQANRRFLITQDLDFSDIGRFRPGAHHSAALAASETSGTARYRESGKRALRDAAHRRLARLLCRSNRSQDPNSTPVSTTGLTLRLALERCAGALPAGLSRAAVSRGARRHRLVQRLRIPR